MVLEGKCIGGGLAVVEQRYIRISVVDNTGRAGEIRRDHESTLAAHTGCMYLAVNLGLKPSDMGMHVRA